MEISESMMKLKMETEDVMGAADHHKEEIDENKGNSETFTSPRNAENKCHETHSFQWSISKGNNFQITCNEAGTVKDSLRRSAEFRKLEEKNKEKKELVVLRGLKAISSHFPCSLIKQGEHLTVKYVKPPVKQKQRPNLSGYAHRRSSDQYVVFNVLPKGRENVVKILRNPAIEKVAHELTVYAPKGETVEQALERDGRFQDIIFKKTCVLTDDHRTLNTEMSNLVDHLHETTFQITLLNKLCPQDSKRRSLDTDKTSSDMNENRDPSPGSSSTKRMNDEKTDEKSKLNDCKAFEILGSQKMRDHFRSQLQNWATTAVKGKATQSVYKLLREEFGKNCDTSLKVKTLKTLMDLSNSVCQIRINDDPVGSGFLLFENFVLTNGHVAKKFDELLPLNPCARVTVHFSFESLGETDGEQEVQGVVAFEHVTDESGYQADWALLSLCPDQKLPVGLLTHFAPLYPDGVIYIIGHPDGDVKNTDRCWIIPINNRTQAIHQHKNENESDLIKDGQESGAQHGLQFLTHSFLENVERNIQFDPEILTYNTCFYFGSSGSPVFDSFGNLVAMHSGGYTYNTRKNQTQSVIEYGYPLSNIIVQMIIQLVKTKNLDVLQRCLACTIVKYPKVMENVKILVDIRNDTDFKTAVNKSGIKTDERLKEFFELFTQTEEPDPMDCN